MAEHFADTRSALAAVCAVLLSAWILLQKREPIATLSWLLSLVLLPYIGFLIYHLLGPTRIKRQSLKRSKARAGLMPLSKANLPTNASDLMQLNAASSGFAPASAKQVDLLQNGASTYHALEQAFAAASHHIHVEYYIFEPDISGTRIRDALVLARPNAVFRSVCCSTGSARRHIR